MMGAGIGGLGPIADTAQILKDQGPRRVSPFFIPSALINLISGQISIRHGLKGPNHAVVTACASGRPRDRRRGPDDRLRRRRRDGGGRGGKLHRADRHRGLPGLQGAVHRLSTTRRRRPRGPMTEDHAGFVMGEGAGVVILEEYEHAKARGREDLCRGRSATACRGDAYHITAPSEDGDGAYRAMKAAVKRAGIDVVRHRLRQRPRHLDHGGLDRAAGRRAAGGRSCQGHGHVLDQVDDRPSAGRRRCDRGGVQRPGHPRPDRAADDQSGRPRARDRHRPGAAQGQADGDRRRHVQQLRLRRHQCLDHLPQGELDAAGSDGRSGADQGPTPAGGPDGGRDGGLAGGLGDLQRLPDRGPDRSAGRSISRPVPTARQGETTVVTLPSGVRRRRDRGAAEDGGRDPLDRPVQGRGRPDRVGRRSCGPASMRCRRARR